MEEYNVGDKALAQALLSGKVGVLPTDTVYGVVGRAGDERAVEKLYKLKNRDNKPGTIIAADIEQLIELGLKERYLKPVAHFWPGAVSVVVPTGFHLDYLHQGKQSLAVRVTADETLQRLLKQTGPLVTSSANLPGEPPANTIKEAKSYFGEAVDFYVEGGDLSQREASTIIRMVDDAVEVLREGAVTISESTGRIES